MWQSLRRMMEDVSYVNIDFVGSLKDFYLFALDKAWWQKLIDRLLDPEVPIPTRPNDGFAYNPRRSRCNATSLDSPNLKAVLDHTAHLRIMCLHQDAIKIVVIATAQGPTKEMRS